MIPERGSARRSPRTCLRRRFHADELASPVRDPFLLEPSQLAAVHQRLAGPPADRE
jgi:hypothetical protein